MTISNGTAIITAAGLINGLNLTGRKIQDTKVVVNGAGSAGIACLDLMLAMGFVAEQCHSLRHQGRHLSRPHGRHDQWKAAYAAETEARSLKELWTERMSSSAFQAPRLRSPPHRLPSTDSCLPCGRDR